MPTLDPPIYCAICTKPLAPSEVLDHARKHGFLKGERNK